VIKLKFFVRPRFFRVTNILESGAIISVSPSLLRIETVIKTKMVTYITKSQNVKKLTKYETPSLGGKYR